jgi:two-component system, response regulator PdtaR
MEVGAKIVLVVEDEPLVRLYASEALIDAGYAVVEASSGDQALQIIEAGEPLAAILTDIEMPGSIDGLKLAWEIETRRPGALVIVVSGRRLPHPDELPQRAQFLAKPYSAERVVEILTAKL